MGTKPPADSLTAMHACMQESWIRIDIMMISLLQWQCCLHKSSAKHPQVPQPRFLSRDTKRILGWKSLAMNHPQPRNNPKPRQESVAAVAKIWNQLSSARAGILGHALQMLFGVEDSWFLVRGNNWKIHDRRSWLTIIQILALYYIISNWYLISLIHCLYANFCDKQRVWHNNKIIDWHWLWQRVIRRSWLFLS